MTPPMQLQEDHQIHAPATGQSVTVLKTSNGSTGFPEAPLSVAALLARMQKLKSAK